MRKNAQTIDDLFESSEKRKKQEAVPKKKGTPEENSEVAGKAVSETGKTTAEDKPLTLNEKLKTGKLKDGKRKAEAAPQLKSYREL